MVSRSTGDDSPSSLWWLLLLLLLPYSCCLLAGLWLRRRNAQKGKGKHKHRFLHFGSLDDDDVLNAKADEDGIGNVANSDFDIASDLQSEAVSSASVSLDKSESLGDVEDSALMDL